MLAVFMCTVTIVPHVDSTDGDGFRLVCNRDERRERAAARPPRVHRLGGPGAARRSAVFPIDPAGGGTWIGVNDAGVAAVLLNRTAGAPSAGGRPPRSRGLVVPPMLGCASVPEALEAAARLDPAPYGPFRLVIVQRMAAGILTSDGSALSIETLGLARPLLFTSSSLGDALVEAPRRRLFERLVAGRPDDDWLAGQARFHAHRWRGRGEASVVMERRDARTVSRTLVDVTSRAIELTYDPLGPAEPSAVRAA